MYWSSQVALQLMGVVDLGGNVPTVLSAQTRDLSYSEFIEAVSAGSVKSVEITGSRISGTYSHGSAQATFETYAPAFSEELLDFLMEKQVDVVARPEPHPRPLSLILLIGLAAVALSVLLHIAARVRRIERALYQLASEQHDEPRS